MQEVEITMPDLSTTESSVLLTKWLVRPGDKVTLGQPLYEVETDKSVMEVESVASGRIQKLLVQEGERADIGQAIAIVLSQDTQEEAASSGAELPSTDTPGRDRDSEVTMAVSAAAKPKKGLFARNKARISGSDSDRIAMTSTQAVVSKRMLESKQSVPHFYLAASANAEAMIAARNAAATGTPSRKIVWDALFVRAAALAMQECEKMKYRYIDGELVNSATDAIGVAVDVNDDLYVIAIAGPLSKSALEISDEIVARVEKIRSGDAEAKRLEPANMTISNLGVTGVESFAAIINPPEACILAVGKTAAIPCVENEQVVIRNSVKLTLSVDHRVVSGKYAGTFLGRIVEQIETISCD